MKGKTKWTPSYSQMVLTTALKQQGLLQTKIRKAFKNM